MNLREDLFGCPVALSSDGDLDAWNHTQLGFLTHAAITPEHLNRTIESDPGFALSVVSKGLFCLLLGRRELFNIAQQAEVRARQLVIDRPISPREKVFLDALCDWNLGFPSRAANRLDQLLLENPADALAMKLVQAIRFVLGDANGMRHSIERVVAQISNDHPAYGYALGCNSFALEETGEYRLAESVGRLGMQLSPDDAWGLHAVTHVYDMTNDIYAGIEWLSTHTHAWEHCNNFRYHVWWHLALMHLDRGEIDAVLDLYDAKIRNDKTDDYRDISNASSLLSRLELEGYHVGSRWEELADLSEARSSDGCLAFADLHYALCLIGGNRKQALSGLLVRMRRDADAEANEVAQVVKHPGLSAAQGLEAFGEGNYALAFRHLSGARDAMVTIGGSHAQRDIFERLTIESAMRSGYFDAAERFLKDRTKLRGGKMDQFATVRIDELARQRSQSRQEDIVPAE